MKTKGKVITTIIVLVVLALAGFVFFKFCFVYSEGTNEGDINYFQREGFYLQDLRGEDDTNGVQLQEHECNDTV